jgi:hypothetical protein
MKILGIDTNAKTRKGEKRGYATAISYLAPSNASGVTNTCPSASKGCREACLFTSGRGVMSTVMEARINKTKFFVNDQRAYMTQLKRELVAFIKSTSKKLKIPCTRLNGTSDIAWEDILIDGQNIMQTFAGLQFYDYTKRIARMDNFLDGKLPANYHLTFSRSEKTKDEIVKSILKRGGNVAAVYAETLPVWDFDAEVINGDADDLRFKDPRGKVVGLTYKRAKGVTVDDAIESGFVLDRVKKISAEVIA